MFVTSNYFQILYMRGEHCLILSTRKRKAISIENKFEIIQAVEKGAGQKNEIKQAFDIRPNTLN